MYLEDDEIFDEDHKLITEYQIASKITEMFADDGYLKDGSFSALTKNPDIKKAADELLFELVRQELSNQRGSIKKPVEKVVNLIRDHLYITAASLI